MPQTELTVPEGFERIDEGVSFLVVRKEWAAQVRRALSPLDRAWERMAQRRFTARGRSGVVSVPLGDGLPPMMFRRYVHGGVLADITRDLYWGPGRALDELAVAEVARAGGVRTITPIGVLCRQMHGPLWRMAFLSRELPDSEDMIHYCCRLTDYPPETAAREKRGAIGEAARQIRRMHDIGIRHADLHLKNLLLQRKEAGTPEVYVIDFDRATQSALLSNAERLSNLSRLARSVRKILVARALLTAWDRIRFLREYLRGMDPDGALLRAWARRLAASGASHEAWWLLTGAQRSLRGDGAARLGFEEKR